MIGDMLSRIRMYYDYTNADIVNWIKKENAYTNFVYKRISLEYKWNIRRIGDEQALL